MKRAFRASSSTRSKFLFFVLALFLAGRTAASAEVTVFAAASLTDALREIAAGHWAAV